MKNNSVCKENGSNVFRKEREQYHEIQDLKAQMQDKNIAISELKKLIEKCKGKSVETQFDKPSVVRQPNAQRNSKTIRDFAVKSGIYGQSGGCGIDGADSDYGYALDRVRMSLPEFDLSGFSNKDTARPKAQNVLAYALFSEIVKSLGVSFDLSPRQKAVVECLRAPRAQNFLTVIPIEGLGQHMSALEYRTILKYRLMIPLFPVDEPCPVCRKVCLDSFGEHAVHCKELPGFKYRHDLVRDVLYDVLKRAGISSRKEAPVNFLTDPLEGRSTLRPADILVFGWAGGKHACVDLTGVSPLVGLRDNGFVAGQAALKAESSKVAKHEKACLENQHVFIPFAFDTFGFLASEADEFLNRVQRVVQSNFSTPKTQNFIFSRIGFAIQKRVAAQLVARLPAILL
ncbi:hypothetical protein Tco_0631671 [Tanacetum coccineum]